MRGTRERSRSVPVVVELSDEAYRYYFTIAQTRGTNVSGAIAFVIGRVAHCQVRTVARAAGIKTLGDVREQLPAMSHPTLRELLDVSDINEHALGRSIDELDEAGRIWAVAALVVKLSEAGLDQQGIARWFFRPLPSLQNRPPLERLSRPEAWLTLYKAVEQAARDVQPQWADPDVD